MPRIFMSDRSVKALKAPDTPQVEYFDRSLPGFGIRVSSHGRKTWIVMYRIGRRVRRWSLGHYPVIGVAEARSMAKAAQHQIAHGHDPQAEKQEDRGALTFEELTREYMERHSMVHKRPLSQREDRRMINREFLPRWRHWKAKDVKRRHIQELLDDTIARGAPIQANRTFALIRKIYNFAVEREIVEISPCMGMRRPSKPQQRDRVLSYDEIRILWGALDAEPLPVAHLLRLQLLTAQRGGELFHMRWEDLDFTTAWWTIPAMFAKNQRTHRVPLSPQVIAILEARKALANGSPWVFPSPRIDGPATTIMKDIRRLREAVGFHFNPRDLRRTAASHMTGMGIPRLTVSKILNHVETGVTAIYDRYSYDLEKQRALLAWGAQLERIRSGASLLPDPSTQQPNPDDRATLTALTPDHPTSVH